MAPPRTPPRAGTHPRPPPRASPTPPPDPAPGAPPPRRRGRPRSESSRLAILRAARALLAEGGPESVTMEGVAARAGVGKPTLYRWWPDRRALAMAALADTEPARAAPTWSGSALGALRQQLRVLVERFATDTGRHATGMIAAADPRSPGASAFRERFFLGPRAAARALLARAADEGEVRADADLDAAADLLLGALLARLLLGHAPLDAAFADAALDLALAGLRRPGRARRGAAPA